MSRLIYSLITLIAGWIVVFGTTSCDDFLETEDKNNSVESNFFTNLEDCEQALWGCYSVLQANNYGHIHLVSEAMSDNSYGGQGTDGDDAWDEFDDRGNQNMFSNAWEKYNWGIHRCNFLLEKLPDAPISPENRDLLEAEARFLRAFFYFDFVRMFGNVPLSTSSSGDDLPQADPKDVYALIAADLVFASDHLADSYPAEWFGRATSWAAKSLLARVYLFYTGYYNAPDLAGVVTAESVRTYVSDVIEEGPYELLPDFRSLWPYSQLAYWTGEEESIFAGENNSEIVFSIKYTQDGTSESYLSGSFDNVNLATGNTWIVYLGPRKANQDVMGAFHYGWGFNPVTPKLYNSYDSDDQRRDASIVDLASLGYGYSTDQKDYTGLWQQKYQPLVDEDETPLAGNAGSGWQYGQGQDYYIIRYADVLLMAAELFLEVNPGRAQSYFNEVRQRAFDPDDYVEVQVNKVNIFKERQLELAFEGIRYYDLLRYDGQDNLDYAKSQIDATSGTVITAATEVDKVVSFRKETKGLLQIPYRQIGLSSELQQNTGW